MVKMRSKGVLLATLKAGFTPAMEKRMVNDESFRPCQPLS
jgi:hypothetical protein